MISRRGFLLALGAVTVPYEPQRVYSFGKPQLVEGIAETWRPPGHYAEIKFGSGPVSARVLRVFYKGVPIKPVGSFIPGRAYEISPGDDPPYRLLEQGHPTT